MLHTSSVIVANGIWSLYEYIVCIDCFLICPQGASIIRMLQSFIGMNALQNGLKVYLDRHKFQNAETDDLWESLSETVRIRNIVWLFFACEFMLWQKKSCSV